LHAEQFRHNELRQDPTGACATGHSDFYRYWIFFQSVIIPWTIGVLGLALAFSIAAILAIVNRIHESGSTEAKHEYSAILATHIGGMICYTIAISFIFPRLS
jgi:hypothetical protein